MAIAVQLDPAKVSTSQRLPTLKPVGRFELGVAYELDDDTGRRALALPDSPFMRVPLKEARAQGQATAADVPDAAPTAPAESEQG